MESLRGKMGFTELFTEFGKICDQEKKRLQHDYLNGENGLLNWREKGYIGYHSINEYMNWMEKQSLKNQYDAFEKMHDSPGGEMARYKELSENIKTLPKKAQIYLHSKRDEFGYKEMHEQFKRFKQGEKIPELIRASSYNPLNSVTNKTLRQGIVDLHQNPLHP